MKKAALLAAGFFFALTVNAQETKSVIAGNGKIITEKREISDFTKLKVSGPFEVKIYQGDTEHVAIEGDENVLAAITTQTADGTLTITTKDGQPVKASIGHTIKIKLPYKNIEQIALTGCGTITNRGMLRSPVLKATVDGPGNITIGIVSGDLTASILGSGSINIEGKTNKFSCRVVGSGTIKAEDLASREVDASISGSGDAKVNSEIAIKGRIVGTGSIAFLGEPKEIDLKHLGTGSFSRD